MQIWEPDQVRAISSQKWFGRAPELEELSEARMKHASDFVSEAVPEVTPECVVNEGPSVL